MRKSHVLVLATLIAVATSLGTYALTRTTELGVQARTASKGSVDAAVAARTRQLNALEISLRKALAKKPPRLPALPPKVKAQPVQSAPRAYASAPVATPTRPRATVTRVAARAPVVRRVKPAPAQVTTHSDEHAPSGGEQDD